MRFRHTIEMEDGDEFEVNRFPGTANHPAWVSIRAKGQTNSNFEIDQNSAAAWERFIALVQSEIAALRAIAPGDDGAKEA